MNDKILDDGYLAKNEIRNKEDIKRALKQAGINSFFEHINGTIIVEQGDAIKLVIHYENDIVTVKPKFPQIGNSVQVLSSGIVLAIFLFLIKVPFPLQWVFAIAGGQIVSYIFYSPKIKELKERIERFV
jgi:hypothetical protein